jgi:hypothetical protein
MDPLAVKIIFSLIGAIQVIAFIWIKSVNAKQTSLEKQLHEFQLQMTNEYNIKVTQLFEKVSHIDRRIDDLIKSMSAMSAMSAAEKK